MNDGMELDPTTLIAVQNERIAAGAIREAQLTAAVQQLTMDTMRLNDQISVLQQQVPEDAEVKMPMHEGMAVVEDEDASADDGG